jgi:SNF2 family DNA or RNA helicase
VQDILWTVIGLTQLIGRCHRLGQTKIVTVFIVVALETVDVLMVEQAHAKGAMLETFLTKKNSKGTSSLQYLTGATD